MCPVFVLSLCYRVRFIMSRLFVASSNDRKVSSDFVEKILSPWFNIYGLPGSLVASSASSGNSVKVYTDIPTSYTNSLG